MNIHQERTKIIYNTTGIDFIKELNPRSVCITSDPFMLELGVVEPFEAYFKKESIPYEIFSDVQPNPSNLLVEKGLLHIIQHKPDVVIAIGGGSAIDLAKAIIYYCLKIKSEIIHTEEIHKPYFIAIPTTSGTGSEVTNYAVITEEDSGQKIVIQSDDIQPDLALLDATLTLTAPPSITADTGFDALTHAIEAYVSTTQNHFSDAYALKAITLIYEHLISAYENSSCFESKKNMQLAATMAGMAFNHSGLGLSHSIAHILGARFHISHGKANALALPAVIQYNSRDPKTLNKYKQIARTLGFNLSSDEENTQALIHSLKLIKKRIDLPDLLSTLNISRKDVLEQLDDIVSEIKVDFCITGNPIEISDDMLRTVILSIC